MRLILRKGLDLMRLNRLFYPLILGYIYKGYRIMVVLDISPLIARLKVFLAYTFVVAIFLVGLVLSYLLYLGILELHIL